MLVTHETLHDAIMFATGALVIVLVSFVFPPERRRGLLTMAIVATFGVAALWSPVQYQGLVGSQTITMMIRELILFVVAFAVIRVFMIFVLSTLLARLAVPRILSEFLLVILLVVYALFRLKAIGVTRRDRDDLRGAPRRSHSRRRRRWGGPGCAAARARCAPGRQVVGNETGQVVASAGDRWRSTNNNRRSSSGVLMKDKVIVWVAGARRRRAGGAGSRSRSTTIIRRRACARS
jgi:hypothetical protein